MNLRREELPNNGKGHRTDHQKNGQKGQKRTQKEGQVQIGKPPRLKPPRLVALESVVWKGAQQTLSISPAAAEESLQVHFNMGASTMPRRQPKSVPEPML